MTVTDGTYIDSMNILGLIRRACNCVDPRLMDHGFRVAGITRQLMEAKGGYSQRQVRDICFLALLHDVGAYKTDEIARLLQFETEQVQDHSLYGYLFIRYFSPLQDLAVCVLHHHTPWNILKGMDGISDGNKEIAQLLYLADRIDVALFYEKCGWEACRQRIGKYRGILFEPSLADMALDPAFSLRLKELIWDGRESWIRVVDQPYTPEEIRDYLMMLVYTIDFRSRHTVTHTITTTRVSWELSGLMGLDEKYRHQIAYGAVLHDVGKVGIPVEILEFPGKLSPQAMAVMRTHVDIGERILGGEISETVKRIALRHHEKLDGSGYPRGLTAKELTVGEQVVAVADIISALTGTRSYKEAYSRDRVTGILDGMKRDGLIDPDAVELFVRHYDEVMEQADRQCRPLLLRYERIQSEFRTMSRQRPGEWVERDLTGSFSGDTEPGF